MMIEGYEGILALDLREYPDEVWKNLKRIRF